MEVQLPNLQSNNILKFQGQLFRITLFLSVMCLLLSECCQSASVNHVCLPICSGSEIIDLQQCSQDLSKIIQCASGKCC